MTWLQVLRDPELRKAHDAALAAQALQSGAPLYDEVSLAEMDMDAGQLTYACRCGGLYCMDVPAEHAASVLLPCSTCSLHLHVLPAELAECCRQPPNVA